MIAIIKNISQIPKLSKSRTEYSQKRKMTITILLIYIQIARRLKCIPLKIGT